MTRKLLSVLTTVAFASMLAGCSARQEAMQAQADEPQSLEKTLDGIATTMLKEFPETATSLAVSAQQAGGKYADRLADFSSEGLDRRAKLAREMRAGLAKIERAKLSPADQVSYDVVTADLDNTIAGDKFGFGNHGLAAPTPYVVTQIDGAYTVIPDFLDSQHQVKSAPDAEDYVARVRAYATMLDQETARIKAGTAVMEFVATPVQQREGCVALADANLAILAGGRDAAASN